MPRDAFDHVVLSPENSVSGRKGEFHLVAQTCVNKDGLPVAHRKSAVSGSDGLCRGHDAFEAIHYDVLAWRQPECQEDIDVAADGPVPKAYILPQSKSLLPVTRSRSPNLPSLCIGGG